MLAALIDHWRRFVGPETTLRHAAWLCVLAGLALSLLGVYAIDLGSNLTPLRDRPTGLSALALKQLLFLGVGIAAAIVIAIPNHRYIRWIAWPSMALLIVMLVVLLLPFIPAWLVTPRKGVRGWINMGPLDLQPAEIGKVAYVLVMAEYLRYRRSHRALGGLITPAAITAVPVGLIVLQPDMGGAVLFFPALFAMLLVAGAKYRHLIAAIVIAAAAGPAAYPMLHPYQKQRIQGMFSMIAGDQQGADDINYQSFTAMTLAGAGGLTGNDDAHSRALIRFNRLPERHNDMIFAVIVNRFGLIGGAAVITLYTLWIAGALAVAAVCKEPFGRLICVGFAAIIAGQTLLNIFMNLGLFPIVGVTLPFLSYGGSSMLTVWIMTGLIFGVGMRPAARLARPSFDFQNDDDPWRPERPDHRLIGYGG